MQFRAEDKLHLQDPERFPPSLITFIRNAFGRVKNGESLMDIIAECKAEHSTHIEQVKAARKAGGSSTSMSYPKAGGVADVSAV